MRHALGLVLCTLGCTDATSIRDAPAVSEVEVVRLSILFNGAPRPNVRVVFQNADSSLVASALTDSAGRASAAMRSGGFVTAFDPFGVHEVATFAGVVLGDRLNLTRDLRGSVLREVTVTMPLEPSATAADAYLIETACGNADLTPPPSGGTPRGTVTLACTRPDLLATVQGDPSARGFLYEPHLAIPVDGLVDLANRAYTPATARTYRYDHGAGVGAPVITDLLDTPRGQLHRQLGFAAGGELRMFVPEVPEGTHRVHTSVIAAGAIATEHELVDRDTPVDYAVDLATRLLPAFTARPVFDAAAHRIVWSQDPGIEPDFVYAQGEAHNDGMRWTWEIVAPAGTEVVYPVFPDDVARFNLTDPFVTTLQTAKLEGGYDRARPTVLDHDARDRDGRPVDADYGTPTLTTATVRQSRDP